MKCHEMSWDVMRCHEMSWDVMRCHEMSWDVMRCHEMSWDVMRCHESWDKVFEKAKKSFTDKSRITLKCGTNGKKRNNCATGIYWIGYDRMYKFSPWRMHHRSESCPRKTFSLARILSQFTVCHRLQLFWTERMRGHKILGNAHSNAAINVQNQVCSLASGNLFLGYRSQRPLTVLEIRECSEIVYAQPRAISLRFHCEGIVQHWCGFKVFLRKSLDDFHLRSSKKLSKMLRSP